VALYNSFLDLQNAVALWINREDDPVILPRTAEFIGLAEAAIRRNQQWFTQVFSLTNAGQPFPITSYPQELPVFTKEVTNIWCSTDTNKGEIEVLPISAWRDLVAFDNNTQGVPTKAVLVPQMDLWMKDDATRQGPQLYLWPPPPTDGSFFIDFKYVRDVPPLSEDTVNNGLLQRHPDLYLYGALIEASPFLQHDERVPLWQARYDKAVKEINLERERAEFGPSAKRPRLPRSF
jgi:hypothetical protein